MSLLVKICGITSPEDARLAVEAGADAIGLIFFPRSVRCVSVERAAEIARVVPAGVTRVGVFVNATRDEMARASDAAGLDRLQLQGDEPPEALAGLPRPAWKAIGVGPGFSRNQALRYADVAAGLLLDTRRPGDAHSGGTGVAFDWSLVQGLAGRVPFLLLAGGLHAGNVAEAVRAVRPHGVDVASGVEAEPGRKDEAKLRAFVRAARETEEVPA